jgi:predicted DNA-binding transcriptional regulator AlpA
MTRPTRIVGSSIVAAAADPYDGLLTAADVARKLGVSRQRGHELAGRDDFPTAVVDVPGKRLWNEDDVDDWIKERTTR